MREKWGMAAIDYAHLEPRSIELVVPDSPLPLKAIASSYPGPWVRASNASGPGTHSSHGLVREWGIVCGTSSLGDLPRLVVTGNSALVQDRDDDGEVAAAPRLVIHGEAVLVKDREITGTWREANESSMVCMGICRGGQVLHVVATSACPLLMARFFVECGCTAALLVADGDACGLLVYGERRLGQATTPVASAIIVRDILTAKKCF